MIGICGTRVDCDCGGFALFGLFVMYLFQLSMSIDPLYCIAFLHYGNWCQLIFLKNLPKLGNGLFFVFWENDYFLLVASMEAGCCESRQYQNLEICLRDFYLLVA